jgi:glutathione S-transferase
MFVAKPVIYGPAYSTYVRSCRLALEEKGADYDLVEIDTLSGASRSPEHLARHPFGKVPAFEHDGLALYETDAIVRYVDEALPGTRLQPADVASRARMTQAINVVGSYAYPAIIGHIVIQRLVMPLLGNSSDEDAIAAAIPQAETAVAALEKLVDGNAYLAGDRLSLADLLLIPVYDYFVQIPEGQKILAKAPNLQRWWDKVRTLPSVEKTKPSLG